MSFIYLFISVDLYRINNPYGYGYIRTNHHINLTSSKTQELSPTSCLLSIKSWEGKHNSTTLVSRMKSILHPLNTVANEALSRALILYPIFIQHNLPHSHKQRWWFKCELSGKTLLFQQHSCNCPEVFLTSIIYSFSYAFFINYQQYSNYLKKM